MARNILLFGNTGSGKSSLANVLCNEVDEEGNFKDFKEIFKEGKGGMNGKTEKVDKKVFTKDNVDYWVIDTAGVGDPALKVGVVIKRLLEGVTKCENGISQIFFISNNPFTKEQVFVLEL